MMQDPEPNNAFSGRREAAHRTASMPAPITASTTALFNDAPDGAVPLLRGLAAARAEHNLFTPVAPQAAEENAAPIPVVVALSGGADSVALLHALHQLAPLWRLSLRVAHLDHALRPMSTRDAIFCAELANEFKLPFYQQRLAPDALAGHADGMEAAARRARYTFLARIAGQIAAQFGASQDGEAPVTVATAHHMGDQAETVLMHLATGAGLAGLAGMAHLTTLRLDAGLPPLRLARPLLAVKATHIRDYLAAYRLAWCEDESNQDTRFLRNRLRHEVLPALAAINPAIETTLARTAERAAADLDRLQQLDRSALEAVLLDPSPQGERWEDAPQPERMVLDLARLRTWDAATQRGVLRLVLQRLGANLREVGAEAVETLRRRMGEIDHATAPAPINDDLQWTILGEQGTTPLRLSLHARGKLPVAASHPLLAPGACLQLPTHGSLPIDAAWLLHVDELTPEQLPPDWRSRGKPWRAFCDAHRLGRAVLTTPQPGMQIAPLGMHGHTRALGDLLTDHKIPLAMRPRWPVVLDEWGGVAWVCGLALADAVRVTETTARLYSLTWLPHGEESAPEGNVRNQPVDGES